MYGAGNEGSIANYTTRLIDNEEIISPIGALTNRKSFESDEITEEITEQNKEELKPLTKITLNYCQRCNKMSNQWLQGVVSYIQKIKTQRY